MKTNLKIAFIAHGLGDGGAERVASILANYLVNKGHQVCFIAALSPNKVYEIDRRVQYIYGPANSTNVIIKLIQKNLNVYKNIIKFNPDVIVSFLTNEAFLTGLITVFPTVYTLRNDPYNYNNSFTKKHIRHFLFKKGKKIVFQSLGAYNYFEESIREKGIIISNPLKEGLPYWKDYKHDNVVITACRLEKQKNIPMMLGAFARLLKDYPDFILKICGDGQLREELEKLADKFGIGKSVEFLGFRTDIHELMAHSLIFVLSSDYEGVSNSMLEALSIGVPVVCTDSSPGGAATFIKNGFNGMLVPVGNIEKFYLAMKQIADDSKLQQKLSYNAISIREELNKDMILKKWEKVIKDAAGL